MHCTHITSPCTICCQNTGNNIVYYKRGLSDTNQIQKHVHWTWTWITRSLHRLRTRRVSLIHLLIACNSLEQIFMLMLICKLSPSTIGFIFSNIRLICEKTAWNIDNFNGSPFVSIRIGKLGMGFPRTSKLEEHTNKRVYCVRLFVYSFIRIFTFMHI